jgi:hypothetical protein
VNIRLRREILNAKFGFRKSSNETAVFRKTFWIKDLLLGASSAAFR